MQVTKYRDASNRFTVEISDMPEWKYSWVKWKLKKSFSLKKKTKTIISLDERFQEFYSKTGSISVDWDNWNGFTVTALSKESEHLVQEIQEFLQNKYGK